MAQKIDKKSRAKKSYSQKARLGRFPYSLVESGNLEKYYKLLTDFKFLTEKINHSEFGVQALIEDYDLIDELPLGREDPPMPPIPIGDPMPPLGKGGECLSYPGESQDTKTGSRGAATVGACFG
ncbi:MAG TPA: hypothetical protein V6D35_05455 [Candidatus Sericytochromatia bacterium]|jgi:hypothetical protein